MKESLLLDTFIHAGFFLAIAVIIIPVLRRFKVPDVLGYLGAGILFGPQALGQFTGQFPLLEYVTLQNNDSLKLLSELGIVFLLFVIGLELTPKKLWQMRSLVFGLGTAQVTLSAIIIGLIAYGWGNSVQASILLGLGLALSSTAIITKWLHEQKLFNTRAGQTSFSILLFQDLAVIPILLLITVFTSSGEGDTGLTLLFMLGKMMVAVIAIVVMGKFFMQPVFSFSNKYGGPEVFIALSFLVIVLSASIAGLAGLSLALGAFIAGLLLAETQYSHEISSIIVPFKSMLLGIFFMAFGMSIDIYYIVDKPLWLFLSVIGLMSLKAAIIYGICRLWRVSHPVATESALLLPQAGEFGLLVVGASITAGIMAEDVGQFMFLTIGLTMLITPFMTPLSLKLGAALKPSNKQKPDEKVNDISPDLTDHIVIFGYGRMGKMVGEILARQCIPTLAFDKNIDRLELARKINAPVYFGDLTKKATLKAAQIDKASAVVITIDTPSVIQTIYKNVRDIAPDVPVIIRAHKKSDLTALESEDCVTIIPEYISASQDLAEKALEYSGYTEEEAHSLAKDEEESLAQVK